MISEFLLSYTSRYEFDSILDIGPGSNCVATDYWLKEGKNVTSLDIEDYRNIQHPKHNFICGNFLSLNISEKFDAVYASHVLEHVQDTGLFLNKIRSILSDDGVLFIAVPPFKHNIVGGHVHVWNMGLLMYNLILCGFDVRNGRFIKHEYNIAGIVKKSDRKLPRLKFDNGDIESLSEFFPDGFSHGDSGDMSSWNWF
jgi:SAM-dependent methyltransferase